MCLRLILGGSCFSLMDQTWWERDESPKFDTETPLWRAFGLGAKIIQHCGVRMLHRCLHMVAEKNADHVFLAWVRMAIRLLPLLLGAIGLGPVSKRVPNVLASRHVLIQPSSRKNMQRKSTMFATHCQNNLVSLMLVWICVLWDSLQEPSCIILKRVPLDQNPGTLVPKWLGTSWNWWKKRERW